MAASLLSLAICATSGFFWARKEAPEEGTSRNERMLAYLRLENQWAWRETSEGTCFVYDSVFSPARCLTPEPLAYPGQVRILMFGDSSAASLYPAMKAHLAGRTQIYLAAAVDCLPLPEPSQPTIGCRSVIQAVFGATDLSSFDMTILRGNFREEAEIERLVTSVSLLGQRGAKRVIVIGPGIAYHNRVPDIISANARLSHPELLNELTSQLNVRNLLTEQALREAAERADVPYVSVLATLCPGLKMETCIHTAGAEGDAITRDASHFTRAGALWWLAQAEQDGTPWTQMIRGHDQ